MTQATTLQLPTEWRDFFALTKPRVMSLGVFTSTRRYLGPCLRRGDGVQ